MARRADDFVVVVVEVGIGHPEGGEEMGLCEFAERLARDAGHDLAEEEIPGVAVEVFRAWLEVECALAVDRGEHLGVGVEVLIAVPRQPHEPDVVAYPRGVVNQVAHGRGVGVVGKVGEVAADGGVEVEVAAQGQQGDRARRDLLGDRGRAEHGRGVVGYPVVQIGHSIARGPDEPAVLDDADRAPGPSVAEYSAKTASTAGGSPPGSGD